MRISLAVVSLALVAVVSRAADPAAVDAEVYYSPDDVLVMVAADLKLLAPGDARYARYLSLRGAKPGKERDDLARLTVATLHDLSGTRGIFPYVRADDPKAAGVLGVARVNDVLLRINTKWFGDTFATQWERLGDVEPYWHGSNIVATEGYKTVEYGHWVRPDGSRRSGGSRKFADEVWETTRTEKEPTDGDAVVKRGFFIRTKEAIDAFRVIQERMVDYRTGDYGTNAPVVDSDWFVGQTLADLNRDPGYHDFLGFKDLADWKKLAGIVEDKRIVDESFLTELREAVGDSGVTRKQVKRRIVFVGSLGGGAWFTNDSDLEKHNSDDADPTVNLVDLPKHLKFDAIESLAPKANGFVLKGLFNDRGVRQDTAPPNIASDKETAPFNDTQIHTGLCFRCHCKGKSSGFRSVDGWVRSMANAAEPNVLGTKDYEAKRRLQDQYVADHIDPYLEASRQRFAASLMRATGWKPEEYAAALDSIWRDYVEGPVDCDMAARRLGVSAGHLQDELMAKRLRDQLVLKGRPEAEVAAAVFTATEKHDPSFAVFRPSKDKLGGGRQQNLTFQRAFQRGADIVHGNVARPYSIRESFK